MGARLGWLAVFAKWFVQLVLEDVQNCPASAREALNLEPENIYMCRQLHFHSWADVDAFQELEAECGHFLQQQVHPVSKESVEKFSTVINHSLSQMTNQSVFLSINLHCSSGIWTYGILTVTCIICICKENNLFPPNSAHVRALLTSPACILCSEDCFLVLDFYGIQLMLK